MAKKANCSSTIMIIQIKIATIIKKDESSDEIFIDVKVPVIQFIEFCYGKITKMISNIFYLINFYKFWFRQDQDNFHREQICIDKDILKIQKFIIFLKITISAILFNKRFFLIFQ